MRLIEWGLATFHTCFLFGALVLAIYLGGNLGSLLGSLNTLVGTAIFLVLWLITWFCTRNAVRRVIVPERLSSIGSNEIVTGLAYGALWGGINGAMFFLVLLGPAAVYLIFGTAFNNNLPDITQALAAGLITLAATLPFALVIGTPVSFVVGGLAGFFFALLDGLLIGAAQAMAHALIPDLDSPPV